MSSVDGEREHEDTWDSLVTWASKNRGDHVACDDREVERIRSGGGEETTGAAGVSIVVEGDGESNGCLGGGGRERI